MEVKLKKDSWYFKAHMFVFPNSRIYPNLCPFFWKTLLACFLFPFVFLFRKPIRFILNTPTRYWTTNVTKDKASYMCYMLDNYRYRMKSETVAAYEAALEKYFEKEQSVKFTSYFYGTDIFRGLVREGRSVHEYHEGKKTFGFFILTVFLVLLGLAALGGPKVAGIGILVLIIGAIIITAALMLSPLVWHYAVAQYHRVCPLITWTDEEDAAT